MIYHTSPQKIEKVSKFGKFDDCLFFSSEIYSMGEAKFVYFLN